MNLTINEMFDVDKLSLSRLSLNDGKYYKISEINEMLENGCVNKINFKKIIDFIPNYLKESGIDYSKSQSLLVSNDIKGFENYIKSVSEIEPSVVKGIIEKNFIPDGKYQFHPLTSNPMSTGRSFEIFNDIRYKIAGIQADAQVVEKGEKGIKSSLGNDFVTLSSRRPDFIIGNISHENKIGNVNGREGLEKFKSQIAASDLKLQNNPDAKVVYDLGLSFNGSSIIDDPRKIDSITKL